MTETRGSPDTNARAWGEQAAYHRDRAEQERVLAATSRSDAGRSAHLVLRERHRQLAHSAALVVAMPDAESPQSSSFHDTGRLVRESYGQPT